MVEVDPRKPQVGREWWLGGLHVLSRVRVVGRFLSLNLAQQWPASKSAALMFDNIPTEVLGSVTKPNVASLSQIPCRDPFFSFSSPLSPSRFCPLYTSQALSCQP